MKVNSIESINNGLSPIHTANKASNNNNFADLLKASIENVNNMQKQSDIKTDALALGKINDLHDVMITAQKASITLETAVQVQRKVIDAYNEVMRMQV